MMLRINQLIETSAIISSVRNFCKWPGYVKEKLSYIYADSQIYKYKEYKEFFFEKIKIYAGNSSLCRIAQIKETNPAILDNSRVAQYLTDFYKRGRDRIIRYLGMSLTGHLAKDIKSRLYLSPIKIVSVIAAAVVIVNVAFFIILGSQITLWGWLMRGLFLSLGVLGLFCRADWQTLKKGSVFLRQISYAQDD